MKQFLMLLLIGSISLLNAQTNKIFNTWIFGSNITYDFTTEPATLLHKGLGNPTHEEYATSASISDENGNLLFYTDGQDVYDNTYATMPNGNNIKGSRTQTQSAIIIPKSITEYYVFVSNNDSIFYSIINTTLNNGKGDVTSKNNFLFTKNNLLSCLYAIPHSNGTDYWLISRGGKGANTYYSFLISNSVSQTPKETSIGYTIPTIGSGNIANVTSNKTNTQIAYSFYSTGVVNILDFNGGTGTFSNVKQIDNFKNQTETNDKFDNYGIAFSANGKYLYVGQQQEKIISQFDISLTSPSNINNSKTTIGISSAFWLGQLRLGPDDRIYTAELTWAGGNNHLGQISTPNKKGLSSNYKSDFLNVTWASWVVLDLPNTYHTSIPPMGQNSSPYIQTAITDQNKDQDFTTYTIDLKNTFNDAETIDANLIYTVSGNTNIEVSITNGIATISSTNGWSGIETVTFTAEDEGGLTASDEVLFTISISNSQPIVANPISDQQLCQNFATYTLDISNVFTDVESNNLTYTISGNNKVKILKSGDNLFVSSTSGWSGTETIYIQALDDDNASTTDTVVFNVAIPVYNSGDLTNLLSLVNNNPNTPFNWDFSAPHTMNKVTWKQIGCEYRVTSIRLEFPFLEKINIDDLTELDSLIISPGTNNEVKKLNVSKNTKLKYMWVTYIKMDSLDVSNLKELEFLLTININTLTYLNVNGASNLKYMNVYDNSLVTINGVHTTNLMDYSIQDNNLSFKAREEFIHKGGWFDRQQDSVFIPQTIFTSENIDYSTETPVNGKDVTFKWYKITNGNNELKETNTTGLFSSNDAGEYYTKMTHPDFPDNPLVSHTTIVNAKSITIISETICFGETYTLGTQNLNITGQFTEIFTDKNGGDSTVTLNLTVQQKNTNTISKTFPSGASYIFGTQTLTKSGLYTEVFTDMIGCDSTITLTLIINTPPTVSSPIPDQSNDTNFKTYSIDLTTAFADIETSDANLIYTVSGNTNIGVNITNGIATISSTSGWSGTETITFIVEDEGGLTISDEVLFTVNKTNTAPIVENPLEHPLKLENFATFSVDLNNIFEDLETPDNNLLYTVSGNSNINITIVDGIATFTSTTDWKGTEYISFTAKDTEGLTVKHTVIFKVLTLPLSSGTELTESWDGITPCFTENSWGQLQWTGSLSIFPAQYDVDNNTNGANGVLTFTSKSATHRPYDFAFYQLTPSQFTSCDFDIIGRASVDISTNPVIKVKIKASSAVDVTMSLQPGQEPLWGNNVATPKTMNVTTSWQEFTWVVDDKTINGKQLDLLGLKNIGVVAIAANYESITGWDGTIDIDYISMGDGIQYPQGAPIVANPIINQIKTIDFNTYTIDLKNVFDDIKTTDDDLIYTVSGNTNIEINITNGIATISSTSGWSGIETITFKAKDEVGLFVTDEVKFSVGNVLSTNHNTDANATMSAYPNPTTGNITVNTGTTGSGTITVRSMLGKTISTQTFTNSNKVEIELPELSNIYLLEVKADNGEITFLKVIKE